MRADLALEHGAGLGVRRVAQRAGGVQAVELVQLLAPYTRVIKDDEAGDPAAHAGEPAHEPLVTPESALAATQPSEAPKRQAVRIRKADAARE